jgi:hypothetical protein
MILSRLQSPGRMSGWRAPTGGESGRSTTVICLLIGALLLIPSLAWLYVIFQRTPERSGAAQQ